MQQKLNKEVADLLSEGCAHEDIETILRGFPLKDAGKRPRGLPYSAWQILEHLRIAQADILDYATNPNYEKLEWPTDYWPKTPKPPSLPAWSKSLKSFLADRKRLLRLLSKSDPLKKISFANNVTLLREILLAADHNAYHFGQLVMIRRLLGNWKD